MLLGIGRTGHIGFNEPGSGRNTRTRIITLDPLTRQERSQPVSGICECSSQGHHYGNRFDPKRTENHINSLW